MTPVWRQLFDSWEKAVAPGLEDMTASSQFRDALATMTRATGSIQSETERMSRQWLHLWNLPAAGDVRALRRQIASLDKEVKGLREELAASGGSSRARIVEEAESVVAAAATKAEK